MIKEFSIISLTQKGEDCLTNNLNEWNKLPPQTKLMWKALFSRTVTVNPFTWTVKVKNSSLSAMLDPEDLIKKIKKSMKNEGAVNNLDFKIEVKKND